MAYNGGNSSGDGGSGNVWSSGSRGGGGSRGGYSRSYNDDDDNGSRGGSGSYRGSFGNNNNYNSKRGGGSYGFRQNNDSGEVEILKDTIFVQNLPKNVTQDDIFGVFSTVGTIKTDDRSGGPKIWIYKDRDTGEPNGRAQVTYEDDETADRAVSQYNDQHIDAFGGSVRVQIAQRRPRNNDRGGGRGGYRGGRSNWDNNPRQGFNSDGNRWGSPRGGRGGGGGGFSDNRRGGGGGGFRGGDSDSFRNDGDRDRDDSYRGSRGGAYRGASRGASGSSNYAPY